MKNIATHQRLLRRKNAFAILMLAIMIDYPAEIMAGDFFLVHKGKATSHIFLPQTFGKATMLAANELSAYLQKITGACVPIDYGKPYGRTNVESEASIINLKLEDNFTMPATNIVDDTFTIEEKDNTLTIIGTSDIAVLYGVYQYLNNLGVMWFMPGEIGENVPKMDDIKLGNYSRIYKPSFRSRFIDIYGYNDWFFNPQKLERQHQDYDLWLLRNKCQFYRTLHTQDKPHDFPSLPPSGPYHHYDFNWYREKSMHNLVAATLYGVDFEKEPERFPLIIATNGVKQRLNSHKETGQVCLTHPENIKAAVKSAVNSFKIHPERISYPLGHEDTADGFCECENCVKANGGTSPNKDPNRVLWKFMNAVAEQLTSKMPDKRVSFFSIYQCTTRPPEDIKAATGVVAVCQHIYLSNKDITDPACPASREYYENVKAAVKAGAELAGAEYTMYAGTPQPLAILNSIKTYHELGAVWYESMNMGRDEQRNIIDWCQAQLAWDAGQDPDKLLTKFCNEYYGAAGSNILAVLKDIDNSCRKIQNTGFAFSDDFGVIMNDEVVKLGREKLAQAKTQASGEKEKERVKRFTDTFEMLAHYAPAMRDYNGSYRIEDKNKAKEARIKAKEEIESFIAFWDQHDLNDTCSPIEYKKMKDRLMRLSSDLEDKRK